MIFWIEYKNKNSNKIKIMEDNEYIGINIRISIKNRD